MMRLLKLTVLVVCIYEAFSQDGMMVQLSEQGLNLVAKMGAGQLAAKILNRTIPIYSGSTGTATYNLKNITVGKLLMPDVSYKTNVDSRLEAVISNITIGINLNWDYQLGPNWLKLKDVGSAVISTSTLTTLLVIKFENISNGMPKLDVQCKASVDKIDINVTGKLNPLNRLYSRIYNNAIRDKIAYMVCEEIVKMANESNTETLNSLKVLVDDQMYLNCSLLVAPIIKAGYMQSLHSGQLFSLTGDGLPDAPVDYTLDADNTLLTKMLRIRVTERMINSASYVYFKKGVYSFSQNMTIAEAEEMLGFKSSYPLIGKLLAKEAPKYIVKSDSITVVAAAEITLDTTTDGILTQNVLTANLSLLIEGNITFDNNYIKANVVNIKTNVQILNNKISALSDTDLILLIQFIVENSQDSINTKANVGIPLPTIKNITFKDTTFKQGSHYFTIDADLLYSDAVNASVNSVPLSSAAQSNPNPVIQQVDNMVFYKTNKPVIT